MPTFCSLHLVGNFKCYIIKTERKTFSKISVGRYVENMLRYYSHNKQSIASILSGLASKILTVSILIENEVEEWAIDLTCLYCV